MRGDASAEAVNKIELKARGSEAQITIDFPQAAAEEIASLCGSEAYFWKNLGEVLKQRVAHKSFSLIGKRVVYAVKLRANLG